MRKVQVCEGWVDVVTCARCGCNHYVPIRRFTHPPPKYTHWAMCPAFDEPILIVIAVDRGEDGEP